MFPFQEYNIYLLEKLSQDMHLTVFHCDRELLSSLLESMQTLR